MASDTNARAPARYRVALLLFEEVDLLDVGGPYEVFLTADRLARRRGESPLFEVLTVSPSGGPVTAFGGMGLVPSAAADAVENLDVLIVPGAVAIEAVAAKAEVRAAVETLIGRAKVTASVCTGAFLLGDQGLLADTPWTTHFEDVQALEARINSKRGQGQVGWVDAGAVVTAGGLSSGLAMALHLVDRLHSRDLAVATAAQLEYAWDPEMGVDARG